MSARPAAASQGSAATPAAARAPAVLGVADHGGWAICVTVAAAGGAPAVVDRRRISLIEAGEPTQPYHHDTVGMPRTEAEALVRRVRESVMRTTLAATSGLRDALESYRLCAVALREPTLSYVPVTVAQAHESYTVMCRADGMMYYDALRTAARHLNIPLYQHPRGQEIARAAARLGTDAGAVERFLDRVRVELGPPWRQEHRRAAAAAIAVLSEHVSLSLPV